VQSRPKYEFGTSSKWIPVTGPAGHQAKAVGGAIFVSDVYLFKELDVRTITISVTCPIKEGREEPPLVRESQGLVIKPLCKISEPIGNQNVPLSCWAFEIALLASLGGGTAQGMTNE
jgi:hypothetical protein